MPNKPVPINYAPGASANPFGQSPDLYNLPSMANTPTSGLPNYNQINVGSPTFTQDVSRALNQVNAMTPKSPVQSNYGMPMPSTYYAGGGYSPQSAAQIMQSLSQEPSYFNQVTQSALMGAGTGGGTLPGGSTYGQRPAMPGVDPRDVPTPAYLGATTLPGGARVGGVPVFNPTGATPYQQAVAPLGTNTDYSRGYPSDPKSIAHALASYGQGYGYGSFGAPYSQIQSWLSNPQVQQNLPGNFSLPQGYQSWQQQQNFNEMEKLLGQQTQAIMGPGLTPMEQYAQHQ